MNSGCGAGSPEQEVRIPDLRHRDRLRVEVSPLLPFYDRLAQQTGNTRDLRFRTAEANRRVGAIRQRLGQSEEAVKAYERAAALFRQLSSDSSLSHSDTTRKVAQIQNELGRLFTSRRQAVEARQAHRAALALLETNAELPTSDPAVRFELARTCFFLGLPDRPLPSAARRERRGPEPLPSERRDSMNKAVMLLRELSTTVPPNPEYQHLLALCFLEGAQVDASWAPSTGKWTVGRKLKAVSGKPLLCSICW